MTVLEWLKRLGAGTTGRSHRVTTITRTVTRDRGHEPEVQEEVVEELMTPEPAPGPTCPRLALAGSGLAGLALGWLARGLIRG